MQLAFIIVYSNLNFTKPFGSQKIHEINSDKKKFFPKKENEPEKNFRGSKKKIMSSIVIGTFFLENSSSIDQTFYKRKNLNLNSIVIDGTNLNLKREDVFNEKFLFSPLTTRNSEVEMEIEEIEDDEYRYSAWKNTQIGLAVGGSALGMWFAYNGLNAWERWMKEQEKKDIEEEIEMTGTYINPGAGNVEASIDPITGKKIQIKTPNKEEPEKKKNSNNENSE
jgi:hypothetical protein